MKYFYTDALEAAYMAKHFKMRFILDFYNREGKIECYGVLPNIARWLVKSKSNSSQWRNCCRQIDKFYIHPDSLKILEPQENDLLRDGTGTPFGYYSDIKITKDIYIIIRDNKHFFWPECEE